MDTQLNQETQIEEALKAYPLVEMPHSITANVMAHIQKETRPTLITWNDFVLSFALASIIASLWFTFINLPPIVLAKLRMQSILLYQDILVNADWLIPTTLIGLSGFLFLLTLPYLLNKQLSGNYLP